MCRRQRARKRERKLALYIAKRNENKDDKQTPIFLSYCSENEDFVSNVIYPSLNTSLQKILKTNKRCIATGDLDFQPGIHVIEGIVTCIETCSVFVACVSKSFCKKAWCKTEVLTAIHEHRPVILIFLEEVEPSLMPTVMRKHFLATTRVTWSNQDAIPKPDVETICRGIVQLMANEQDESNIDRGNNECAVADDELVGCFLITVTNGKCWIHNAVVLCEDSMPNEVQDGVTTVKIFNLDLSVYLQKDIFQHRSWRNVEHLLLQPDVDSSGAALRGNNMRNLKRLNISEISVWSKSIRTFGSEFFDCFRHLEELDLSQSDSVLIPYDFADALPFLQSLNLENSGYLAVNFMAALRPLIALPVDNFGAIPLQVLDISHNSIISIDLALIGMAKYMVDIDLSNNKLYLMEGRKLKYCFKGTPKIYRINLSNNRLAKLPVELFSTNHILEYIDLSYNKLSTLSFKISHLLKLKVLDVSFNEIHFFEDSALTRLYDFRQSVLVYSEKFTMKLGGNPYVCSCESKEFLRWMIDPGFSNYIHPKVVECLKSKSQTSVIIDKSALADAEFECKLTMIIGVSSALSAIVVIMLGILVFIMCRRYRARKREKQLALFIMKRRDTKQAEQTPIFLSYCSENYDFVVNVIYPKLNSTLQKILKSDKRCIATGDLDFRPGIHVNEEIVSCIETCSVFVACVSNAFCRKAWCKSEVLTAIHENRPVILIFLEEVEPSLMPKVMRKHFLATTRVTWCNQDEMPKPD
ncbi:TLR4-like protein, partial [Mya arenaria]